MNPAVPPYIRSFRESPLYEPGLLRLIDKKLKILEPARKAFLGYASPLFEALEPKEYEALCKKQIQTFIDRAGHDTENLYKLFSKAWEKAAFLGNRVFIRCLLQAGEKYGMHGPAHLHFARAGKILASQGRIEEVALIVDFYVRVHLPHEKGFYISCPLTFDATLMKAAEGKWGGLVSWLLHPKRQLVALGLISPHTAMSSVPFLFGARKRFAKDFFSTLSHLAASRQYVTSTAIGSAVYLCFRRACLEGDLDLAHFLLNEILPHVMQGKLWSSTLTGILESADLHALDPGKRDRITEFLLSPEQGLISKKRIPLERAIVYFPYLAKKEDYFLKWYPTIRKNPGQSTIALSGCIKNTIFLSDASFLKFLFELASVREATESNFKDFSSFLVKQMDLCMTPECQELCAKQLMRYYKSEQPSSFGEFWSFVFKEEGSPQGPPPN